jgi:hypothetical protein
MEFVYFQKRNRDFVFMHESEVKWKFVIVEGLPKEENLPDGNYIGLHKKTILDRYDNEVPILERVKKLDNSNEIGYLDINAVYSLFQYYNCRQIKSIIKKYNFLLSDETKRMIDFWRLEIGKTPCLCLLENLKKELENANPELFEIQEIKKNIEKIEKNENLHQNINNWRN